MSPNILIKSDQSIPVAVAGLLSPIVWSGEEEAKKAALVVQRVVYGGLGLKEAAKEAGLSVREARELARTGWFGELVSQAVGSKLVVMSEFRCARLRERMEMIEEQVEQSRESGDSDAMLKWLEQARKEMESGKGLEGVLEALGSRNGGPMIQVNIERYEASPSQEPAMRDASGVSNSIQAEYSVGCETIEERMVTPVKVSEPEETPRENGTDQVAQREAAEEASHLIGYGPEDDSLDTLFREVSR